MNNKYIALTCALALGALTTACSIASYPYGYKAPENKETTVIYYSQNHSTKSAALAIAARQNSSICELTADGLDGNKCGLSLAQYEYVIVGSPAENNKVSDVVAKFFKNNNLDDKTVIPFAIYTSFDNMTSEVFEDNVDELLPNSSIRGFESFVFNPVMQKDDYYKFIDYLYTLDKITK